MADIQQQTDHFVLRERVYAPGTRMARHCDDLSHLSIVISGSLLETIGCHENHGRAHSVVCKPANQLHTTLFGDRGARILSLQLRNAPRLHQGYRSLCERYTWHHNVPVMVSAVRLSTELHDSRDHLVLDSIACELVAGLAHALNIETDPIKCPRFIKRCQEILHDQFTDQISLSFLADQCAVHPVYLSRAFRKHFGCSIGNYKRRLQVAHAAEAIAVGEQGFCQIALDAGFCDQAHLCRVFKRHTGLTPKQYQLLRPKRAQDIS